MERLRHWREEVIPFAKNEEAARTKALPPNAPALEARDHKRVSAEMTTACADFLRDKSVSHFL